MYEGCGMPRHEILVLFFLSLLVLCVYSNTFEAPFVFDDSMNIQSNTAIRLTNFTMEGIAKAGFQGHIKNRPLANISFALNYCFHQYNIVGYHVVNSLTHIANGILLYIFVRTTLRLCYISAIRLPRG